MGESTERGNYLSIIKNQRINKKMKCKDVRESGGARLKGGR